MTPTLARELDRLGVITRPAPQPKPQPAPIVRAWKPKHSGDEPPF